MKIRTNPCQRIPTHSRTGEPIGYLVPIYNVHDPFYSLSPAPQQVYLTVVAGGQVKGPHLHLIRRGFFTCIKGNVRFVFRPPAVGGYQCIESGEDHYYRSLEVPPGVPLAIQNLDATEALVLNLPTPA